MLSDSFDHAMQDESARQDSVEMEKFRNLQFSKFINHNDAKMVDVCVWKYGMSTNLPRHGPKWNSANYGLEAHND